MQPIAEISHRWPSYAHAGKRKLPLPMADGLRIAQVSPRALLFADSQFLSPDQAATLSDFKPQVLIGSASELELLAVRSDEGIVELSSLDRAVFVITDCRDVPLRESARTILWKAFGVPVFELLLGGDGSPIAAECDVHDGWHVEDAVLFSTVNGELWFQRKREVPQGTGLRGEIDSTLCPCGRPGNRILNAAMDLRDPVRHYLAKTA